MGIQVGTTLEPASFSGQFMAISRVTTFCHLAPRNISLGAWGSCQPTDTIIVIIIIMYVIIIVIINVHKASLALQICCYLSLTQCNMPRHKLGNVKQFWERRFFFSILVAWHKTNI